MDKRLIFDLGFHQGESTDYYLHEGFRVVAIEANPFLIEQDKEKFAREISNGQLILLNKGISDTRGTKKFFINRDDSRRSSLDNKYAATKSLDVFEIEIECIPITDLFNKFGFPYYIKCDIGGTEYEVLDTLNPKVLPSYISVDANNFRYLSKLSSLRYKSFKLINQKWHSKKYIFQYNWFFELSSAGPFGEETYGKWQNLESVAYIWLNHYFKNRLFNQMGNEWCYDLHASLQSPCEDSEKDINNFNNEILDKVDIILSQVENFNEQSNYLMPYCNALGKPSPNRVPRPQYKSVITADEKEFQNLYSIIRPYTRLTKERLRSLYKLLKMVCVDDIPGNFVEWSDVMDGSLVILAYVLKNYGKRTRMCFTLYKSDEDSQADRTDLTEHYGSVMPSIQEPKNVAILEEAIRDICVKLDVWDVIITMKGNIEDTLRQAKNWFGIISFFHLNGIGYETTKCLLDNLYHRVMKDGGIQVENYNDEGCRKAFDEYMARQHCQFTPKYIDDQTIKTRKPDGFPINPTVPQDLVNLFTDIELLTKSIPGYMTQNEHFQLIFMLANIIPSNVGLVKFVEIGSFCGASLLLITKTLRAVGHQVQGFAIDSRGESPQRQILIGNVNELLPDITFLNMKSHEASELLRNQLVTDDILPMFIFIDGDHSYEGVKKDIIDFYPLLAPDGIMVFHDDRPPLNDENRGYIFAWNNGMEYGIRRACQEIMENTYGCQLLELPLLYPTDQTPGLTHMPIIETVYSTIRAYIKPCD